MRLSPWETQKSEQRAQPMASGPIPARPVAPRTAGRAHSSASLPTAEECFKHISRGTLSPAQNIPQAADFNLSKSQKSYHSLRGPPFVMSSPMAPLFISSRLASGLFSILYACPSLRTLPLPPNLYIAHLFHSCLSNVPYPRGLL